MIVVIDERLLTDDKVDPLDAVAIIAVCADRRHTLVVPPQSSDALDGWLETHFAPRSSARRRILRVVSAGSAMYPNMSAQTAKITVVPGPTDWKEGQLTPCHAVRLLHRPLRLLVENRRNDAAFLRCMAEPADRRQLDEAVEKGWIEFEMGGGIPELAARIDELAGANLGDHTKMIERARTWTMFDRDAHPDDRSKESEVSRAIREKAEAIQIPWPLAVHQLERRAVENYVPGPTLRTWWCAHSPTTAKDTGEKEKLRRQRLVEAFLTPESAGGLSPKARHHYNMKKGLKRDIPQTKLNDIHNTPLTDADLDPLFQGLDPQIRDVLLDGGGFKNLAGAFSSPGVIVDNEFQSEVDRRERRRLLASLFSRM